MTSDLNVLHLTPSIGPVSGGLGTVALALAREQHRAGCRATIWTTDALSVAEDSAAAFGFEGTAVGLGALGPRLLAYSPNAERRAGRDRFSVIHQHGIWTAQARVTGILRRRDIPTVIAPHGSLYPYVLQRSYWKKRLALALYEMPNLRSASCLHATADSELACIRDFGLTGPVALIPNGVDPSWLDQIGDAGRFRSRFGIEPGLRVLLFFSRLDPKKGLALLVDAVAGLREKFDDWVVVVAGPDERGHQKLIEQRAAALGVGSSFRFIGPVYGEAKADMFAGADAFILPTHSDNFAIVVAEALGAGVPVITTHGAPWRELVEHGCGWWVPVSVNAVREAILEAVSLSPASLRSMGARGRRLVADRYTLPAVTAKTIALYEWLMGRTEKPEFVVVD